MTQEKLDAAKADPNYDATQNKDSRLGATYWSPAAPGPSSRNPKINWEPTIRFHRIVSSKVSEQFSFRLILIMPL